MTPTLQPRSFSCYRGPKRGHAFLSGYLEEQVKRVRVIKEDPALMAEHLVSLLTGVPVQWLVLGLQMSPANDIPTRSLK